MAKKSGLSAVPSPRTASGGYPIQIQRDGINVRQVSKSRPLMVPRPNHIEWHDSKTDMPCDRPEYMSDGDDDDFYSGRY